MEAKGSACSCRWATPTLFQPGPTWLSAWDRPWTCLRTGEPRPLLTTECCWACNNWEPHLEEEADRKLTAAIV